ncbi:hypothetical protein BDA96_02G195600 [Sorghum bicolor]|jgi:hypothetical protein|uniref:Uncharacterized protein n=1 Tax=Sorghum bicolor TaxID=4558 RepID=A0A921RNW8_SORBI|nr:hypothetical protein BDA96_02G195600 [Sorghum bicolor]
MTKIGCEDGGAKISTWLVAIVLGGGIANRGGRTARCTRRALCGGQCTERGVCAVDLSLLSRVVGPLVLRWTTVGPEAWKARPFERRCTMGHRLGHCDILPERLFF